jgi:hypothetical protein
MLAVDADGKNVKQMGHGSRANKPCAPVRWSGHRLLSGTDGAVLMS